ncbi:unnamed protein product [Didymodactylos carnosus]|uniref:Aquaporin n=1 Tax=Didymodactylos carnosus TaxID=1234261 RepID=A0A814TQ30_9BILA|nr:unnamed protein product [Didymodactylos carnosus]CAF1163850.1 unnamed protein product [Didymodactylos carnosus]CAF3675838.1 unnamed protein product [Didymodactylos carnosus]CAF3927388.1 unnamed protein product [Didymodactylos carnosus]
MSTAEPQLREKSPLLRQIKGVDGTASEIGVYKSAPTMINLKDIDSSNGKIDSDRDEETGKFFKIIRPLLVELIGTCIFILTGMFGACHDNENIHPLIPAFVFGLTLMAFAASFGHISGVHFNPAVTLGIFIAGQIGLVMAILDRYSTCAGGSTFLGPAVKWWEGLLIECTVTFLLVTVILMVAVDTKSKTILAPIVIGLTLTGGILGAATFTGGSLNPARSFGPSLIANQWRAHYIYFGGPLLGSLVAGFLYRLVWAHTDRRYPKQRKH